MKILFFILATLLSFAAITSCQKEIILNNPSTDTTSGGGSTIPPSTNGDLLVKVYGKIGSGADSNVTYFSYNAAKQLITRRVISNTNGGFNNYDAFERNSAGLIVRRKQYFISGGNPIQADTAVTNYYYTTGATPQLKYSVSIIGIPGFSVNDSAVYTFNASGKLSKFDHYNSSILTGNYSPASKYIFSFDVAGNITKLDVYLTNAGVETLVSTELYTSYDTKTVSQVFTEAESAIISSAPTSTHNATKVQINNFVSGAGNITNDFTINYNSANKPATTKQVMQYNGTTTITNSTLYYQ